MISRDPLLSVVVPCFNEQEVLWETYHRLTDVLDHIPGIDYELIFVDDGSRDATPEILRQLHALHESEARIRIVGFSRNFGHQTAVTAGIEHARGDAVVLIDADLQDPPEVIPAMIERWREGFHVVYGRRTDRPGETAFKLLTAKVFYRLLNRLSETDIPSDTGDFRLIDRRVMEALRTMPERDRFLRGMVAWAGFRQIGLPYARAPRLAGESKYPLVKMMRFAVDGVVSFSVMPLRAATWMGFVVSALAIVGIVYALVMRLFSNNWVTGWTTLVIAVLLLGGVQLLALGLIGEYVGRIYGEAKRRPLYLVQERVGFEQPTLTRPAEVDMPLHVFRETPVTAPNRAPAHPRLVPLDSQAEPPLADEIQA